MIPDISPNLPIFTRRSCRKYTTQVPSRPLVEQVIQAGLYAPSGHNGQSWLILTIMNPEIQERLRHINAQIMGTDSDPFYGAPVIIIVLGDTTKRTYECDGALALGNMMLEAHRLGMASCWINRAKETFALPEWKEWLRSLNIEADRYEGIGHLALGFADGPLPAPMPRKPHRTLWID